MRYKRRFLESRVTSLAKSFKVILVLGARQVGKSTLFKHLFPKAESFYFDSILDPYQVKRDPDLFLDLHAPPLVLDEVQFVPTLLSAIKRRVDTKEEKGLYFLTGSQNLNLLKSVSETMTGRAVLLQMEGMSLLEWAGFGDQKGWLNAYLENPSVFIQQQQRIIPNVPPLHETLWRGSLPQALELPREELSLFFNSYIQTYVERDLRLAEKIDDLHSFGEFLSLLGALSGQEINYSQLGREIGVTPQTAKRWAHALGTSYQWREVLPLHNNTIKKLTEKRKGFLTDSGIACQLLRIGTPEDLAIHPSLGAIFETWVVNHLYQLLTNCNTMPGIYHFRAHSGSEIDLVFDLNGTYFPIEIKCTRNLSAHDLRNFKSFRSAFPNKKIAPGLIIHAGDESYLLDKETLALSWKTF